MNVHQVLRSQAAELWRLLDEKALSSAELDQRAELLAAGVAPQRIDALYPMDALAAAPRIEEMLWNGVGLARDINDLAVRSWLLNKAPSELSSPVFKVATSPRHSPASVTVQSGNRVAPENSELRLLLALVSILSTEPLESLVGSEPRTLRKIATYLERCTESIQYVNFALGPR
jgi:hypothetical protein